MQLTEDHVDETTYAARVAAPATSVADRHVIAEDSNPSDRSLEIFKYVTAVAERTHNMREMSIKEANKSKMETA